MVRLVITEKWSKKYKRSIDCDRPRGFSQRAHCQGKKKNENLIKLTLKEAAPAQYRTYGELKKVINGIMNKEKLKAVGDQVTSAAVDQVLGLIPGASNVKSAFDFVKAIYSATDDKKTNTFLDKINIDDQYAKIVDDKVEMAFLKFLTDAIINTPDETPLPQDFDVNAKLQDYLKKNFANRTLAGTQPK